MKQLPLILLILGFCLPLSCKKLDERSTIAAGGSPDEGRPAWLKSPEVLLGTITNTWSLQINRREKVEYFDSIYPLLGGTMVKSGQVLVKEPNGLYLLAVTKLTQWLSTKLIDQQEDKLRTGEPWMFDGIGAKDPDQECFKDDTKDWCDFEDHVTMTYLTDLGGKELSLEDRKRLMHNIQDIGEFFDLAIDNLLLMPQSSYAHAPHYLLDEVLIPSFERNPTAAGEANAWREVVHAIILGGNWFLEAPLEGTGE